MNQKEFNKASKIMSDILEDKTTKGGSPATTCSQQRCSKPFPCLASIWTLSGVEKPCDNCEPFVQGMRDMNGWKPLKGKFWMTQSLADVQRDNVLDRINEITANAKVPTTARVKPNNTTK